MRKININKISDLFGKLFDPLIATVEKLSKLYRIVICIGVFLVLIGAFVWASFLPKYGQVHQLKKDIDDTEKQLAIATAKANKLSQYREEKKKAEADFRIAKKALPDKKEIPSLLTGISRVGKDAGLKILLFQPRAEIEKDFYAEIPVSIKVVGPYHNIAIFFDKGARLFRVVNITDIKMDSKKETINLDTSCTAVTYRFVEPKPETKKQPPKKGKGKKK